MNRFTLPIAFGAVLLVGGCAGTVGYSGTVETSAPDLVYVSPGVQVIADYDEPIFYSDNYYWRNDGGTWYRSRSYNAGWVYASPPAAVIHIDRPQAYVHYRPEGWVDHRSGGRPEPRREERRPEPMRPQPVRVEPQRPEPQRAAPPPPAPRDHRDDHHDDRGPDRDHRH